MLFALFLGYAVLGAVFGIFRLGKTARKFPPNVYAPANVGEQDLVLEEDGDGEDYDENGDGDGEGHHH